MEVEKMYADFTFQAQGFDFISGSVWVYEDNITFMGCTTIDKRSYLCSIEKEKGKRRRTVTTVERYDDEKRKFVGAKRYDGNIKKALQAATIAKYEIYMKLNKPF
jgi:hypothetical protein